MLLSGVVFLPIVFVVILMFFSNPRLLRPMALVFSLVEFVLSLTILSRFDTTTPALQMVEKYIWIERFGISYFFGIDGLSLWLLILTTFFIPIVILGSWNAIEQKVKGFLTALFVLQTAMLGSFLALDAVFFYLFWEFSLVPMYFMIGVW